LDLFVHPEARALIFDIDGTLVNTMPYHYQSWEEVGNLFGFTYSTTDFHRNAGLSTARIVALLNDEGYQLDPSQIIAAKNAAYLRLLKNVQPIESVFKLVRDQYGRLPFALGTGEYRSIALATLQAAKIQTYFTVLVAADDVSNPKPDPERFSSAPSKYAFPRNIVKSSKTVISALRPPFELE